MNDYNIKIRYGISGSEGKILKVSDIVANCYNHSGVMSAVSEAIRKNGIAGKNVLYLRVMRMDWDELDEVE